MPLLDIKNLYKSYPLDGKDRQSVLKGLNFSLDKGELVAIIGESGSGKSTLLNLIGGLDTDYEGDIEFDGKELKEYKGNKIDDYRKLKVGFVFQSFNLISTYTTLENIMTGANMTNMPKEEREARAKALVEKLGLQGLENKLPAKMSGGQKQRVAIARAMMNNPDMILADEPTGALDKDNSANVTELLKQIAAEGTLVVVVTHSEKVAKRCDRVITLEYGDIASDVQVEKEEVETTQEQEIEIKESAEETIVEKVKEEYKPKSLKMGSAIKTAFKNIKKNKTRNILVSVGAGIGIFAVVILLFISSGMKSYVSEKIYATTNPLIVEVSKKSEKKSKSPHGGMDETTSFTQEEIDKLNGITHVDKIQPTATYVSGTNYKMGDKQGGFFMFSVVTDNVKPTLKHGKMPKENEILINEAVAKELSDDEKSLIGKEISVTIAYDINNKGIAKPKYKISGIIENDGTPMANFTLGYVTMSTLQKSLPSKDDVDISSVILVADNKDNVESIKTQVKEKGFVANRQEEMLKSMMKVLDIVTYGLTAIAAISLVVSGIMILVVLYISVVERTKEIGTLRAMGSSKGDIKRIFISEGFLIGVFGGIVGITFAILLGLIGNQIFDNLIQIKLIDINIVHSLFGILISVVVSTIASLIPASKAAKLDPIEALRYE